MTRIALILLALCPLSMNAFAGQAVGPFVLVENGLVTPDSSSQKGIPFDRSWLHGAAAERLDELQLDHLPQYLPIPDYVRVYEYCSQHDEKACSLSDLARAARSIVDSELSQHGVVLFRNLDQRIHTVHDFNEFWSCCCAGQETWKPTNYVPFGANRPKLENVDLATNIPSQMVLPPHNEMVYNPRPPSRIAFYCLQQAKAGGETLVARNAQVTDSIRPEILDLVRQSGLLYIRRYNDRDCMDDDVFAMSWQEKCETDDKGEAVRYFTDIGFLRDDIRFDDSGTMLVRFVHPGIVKDAKTGRDKWFNIFSTGLPKQMDGSDYPWETVAQAQLDEWGPVCAFKLQKGDWLVLDNTSVRHGRLNYTDDPDGVPRTLLTVYTE